jgi:hypothetical protein
MLLQPKQHLHRRVAELARLSLSRARRTRLSDAAASSAAHTYVPQALERLRDRQDKDSRRAALLAELSANNSNLQALQQQQHQQQQPQQPGGPSVAPSLANMLTSSRTIGLGARVAATRAPDGSHLPQERRGTARKRRGGAVVAATTTALSGSSSSESDDDGDTGSSCSGSARDEANELEATQPIALPNGHVEGQVQLQVAAVSASSSQTIRNLQRDTPALRRPNSNSSSSSSEDEDAAASTAGNNQLNRGATVAHPIARSNEARDARLKLPIVAEEQPLMDLVHHRTCVVLQVHRGVYS